MWTDQSVFYQIYPLGAFGAPFENDGQPDHRILKMESWIAPLKELGIDAVLLNPVCRSMTHGYDTVDYKTIDNRLGTNEDMIRVIDSCHQNGLRILFDGVFNHVGRDFFAFRDVLKNRVNSIYKDWFYIDFNGNNGFDDHFSYQSWEGNDPLVKLNLQNEATVSYLLEVIGFWMDTFHIDGIRFDVAYSLDLNFLRRVRSFCKTKNPDFFLLGETLHGDYNTWVNEEMLDSCTNYECYKGLYSSFNSRNFYEILHSFHRQFGQDEWCLYQGKHLFNFVDNHDVVRIATNLSNKHHLPQIYVMLMTMPGIPCLYYGSEWGLEGDKNWNDSQLRPEIDTLQTNDLTQWIRKLIRIKHEQPDFHGTDYRQIAITNTACIYQRGNCWICFNMDENPCTLPVNEQGSRWDLLHETRVDYQQEIYLEGYQCRILKKDVE
ncbi:MAG: cyclomaltodextrinase [Erysipelotrichaceae bacterium]|nr:cyclomaltodextrinase [Erysipelotrichaceae bacterium]